MISVKAAGAKQLAEDLKVRGTKTDAFQRAMRKAALVTRYEVRKDLGAAGIVQKRSGKLYRSFRASVEKDAAAGHIGVVKPKIGYAVTLFRGATIEAKTKAGLVFPLAFGAGGMIRGGVFKRTKKQATNLAKKAGSENVGAFRMGLHKSAAGANVAWVRVQRVRIPARDFLSPGANRAAPRVADLLGRAFLPRVIE